MASFPQVSLRVALGHGKLLQVTSSSLVLRQDAGDPQTGAWKLGDEIRILCGVSGVLKFWLPPNHFLLWRLFVLRSPF